MTLAEAWDGTSWSIQDTPDPDKAPVSVFSGVSCTASDTCTAIGFHTKPTGTGATLAEGES